MPDLNDAVSTLVLVNDEEYVLRASRGRVLFDCYSHEEASREQAITLTLDKGNADSTPSTENAAVPIILSAPGTPRFELSTIHVESSPLEFLLTPSSPRTFTVKFNPPALCESDYAWDNFQDQIVVHTRLSKLVVHLEAWKDSVPSELAHDRRNHLMIPANLPDVKAPPLKRFGVVEGNGTQRSTTQLQHAQPSPSAYSRKNLATASLKSTDQPTVPVVATIQSLREAHEVILKLRCRRRFQSTTKAMKETSPASGAERELFPETTALDADTKTELDEFNDIVVAARNQAKKDAAKVKSELAYYQQLVPVPPPRDCALEMAATSLVGRRKARQMSAAIKRPSRLPALVRPSSGAASSSVAPASSCSANNQETSLLDQDPQCQGTPARQRVVRPAKPKTLSVCLVNSLGSKLRGRSGNQKHAKHLDASSELSDFDDSDPEVDEAPVLPDDLSGVATLDADDLQF